MELNKEIIIKLTNAHLFSLITAQKMHDLGGHQKATEFYEFYTDGVKKIIKTFLKFFCKDMSQKTILRLREACKTTYEINEMIGGDEQACQNFEDFLPNKLLLVSEGLSEMVVNKGMSLRTFSLSTKSEKSEKSEINGQSFKFNQLELFGLNPENGLTLRTEQSRRGDEAFGVGFNDFLTDRKLGTGQELEFNKFQSGGYFSGIDYCGYSDWNKDWSGGLLGKILTLRDELKSFKTILLVLLNFSKAFWGRFNFILSKKDCESLTLSKLITVFNYQPGARNSVKSEEMMNHEILDLMEFFSGEEGERNTESFLAFFKTSKNFKLICEQLAHLRQGTIKVKELILVKADGTKKGCFKPNFLSTVLARLFAFQNQFMAAKPSNGVDEILRKPEMVLELLESDQNLIEDLFSKSKILEAKELDLEQRKCIEKLKESFFKHSTRFDVDDRLEFRFFDELYFRAKTKEEDGEASQEPETASPSQKDRREVNKDLKEITVDLTPSQKLILSKIDIRGIRNLKGLAFFTKFRLAQQQDQIESQDRDRHRVEEESLQDSLDGSLSGFLTYNPKEIHITVSLLNVIDMVGKWHKIEQKVQDYFMRVLSDNQLDSLISWLQVFLGKHIYRSEGNSNNENKENIPSNGQVRRPGSEQKRSIKLTFLKKRLGSKQVLRQSQNLGKFGILLNRLYSFLASAESNRMEKAKKPIFLKDLSCFENSLSPESGGTGKKVSHFETILRIILSTFRTSDISSLIEILEERCSMAKRARVKRKTVFKPEEHHTDSKNSFHF